MFLAQENPALSHPIPVPCTADCSGYVLGKTNVQKDYELSKYQKEEPYPLRKIQITTDLGILLSKEVIHFTSYVSVSLQKRKNPAFEPAF